MANPAFIPYLVNGLFVDPEHHAECLAQLALYPQAKDALRQDSSVREALQTVAEHGLSSGQATEHAQAALMALGVEELQMRTEGQKHVMLSYQVCARPFAPSVRDLVSCADSRTVRAVGCAGYDLTRQRLPASSGLPDVVRPHKYEGKYDGRDE